MKRTVLHNVSRRGFIKSSGLAALSSAVGSLIPHALAAAESPIQIPGKSGGVSYG